MLFDLNVETIESILMQEMNPRSILRYITWVLFRRKWSMCFFFGFTILCFIFGTFLITPQWQARAKILVLQDPKQQMILFRDLESPIPSDRSSSATDIVEILNGNELAAEVVKKFNLDERKRRATQEPKTIQEWTKWGLIQVINLPVHIQVAMGRIEKPKPNFFEKALDDLIEEMEDIELVDETSTITLTIWADSPDLAVDICNFMVERLIEKTTGFERTEASKTYDFVSSQLKGVETDLVKAEDELAMFKKTNKLVDLDAKKKMLLDQQVRLSGALNTKQTDLAALVATQEELSKQLGPGALVEAPSIVPDIQPISDNTEEKSEFYNSLRNSISESELEQSILQNQLQLARAQGELQSLDKQLTSTKKELESLNDIELEQTRLLRSSTGLQERYVLLRQKQLELEVQKYTETSEFDIKIADAAYIPPRAETDWPKWSINLIVGAIFGVGFAVGQAFLFEYWKETFREDQDVEAVLGIEVLGSVKPISFGRLGSQLTRVSNS